MSWMEIDETQDEGRIPYDVLDTIEAETVFKNHLNVLQQEQKRLESVSNLFFLAFWIYISHMLIFYLSLKLYISATVKLSNELPISSFTNNSMFLMLPPDADYLGGMLNIWLYKCFSLAVLFLDLITQALSYHLKYHQWVFNS